MRTRLLLPLLVAGTMSLVACAQGGSDAVEFDADRACRIGQRLIEETAVGDRNGVIRQIERLDDLEEITDSELDVDELDEIAEGLDQDAVDELTDEFEAIDCDIDSVVADTPPDTEPPVPTSDLPNPTTDPAPVDPAPTPPVDSALGIPVDIGATGPGRAGGVDRPTESIIAELGFDGMLFSPDTNVVGFSVDRNDYDFGLDDEADWFSYETITMSATTATTPEQIRDAYRAAIETRGFSYEFTDSTTSGGDSRTVSLTTASLDFDLVAPEWEITIRTRDDAPGVVDIEVGRSAPSIGALPPLPAPAADLLSSTATIVDDLGWELTSYSYYVDTDIFDGITSTFGSLDWWISADDTLVACADALQAALGGGPFESEDVQSDRISWFLPNDDFPYFSVTHDEFSGTTASFSI